MAYEVDDIEKSLKEKEKQLNEIREKFINEKREKDTLQKENKDLKNKIKNLEKENVNIKEKSKLEKDPLEFYDIIININSMQNISNDGWEIYMNENGKRISELKNDESKLVIGVMGNRNKGKSFMLQALSGEELQTGSSISTIGLSIKYSENKFVLLDCAGSESPLLGDHANMLEISRDKLFTEAFLQSYILRKSNVLLLVIGFLSFSEQKLINKIIRDLEKFNYNNKKNNKNLIIVHNLQTYETQDQIKKYINETLLKSASFKIKKDESNFNDNNDETEFFYDIENPFIKHFIYAKENSEAGNIYNKRTLDLIKSLYKIETNKYKYDFKETIREHFNYMGEKMFDLVGKMKLDLEEIKDDEINENIDEKKNNINFNDKENERKKDNDQEMKNEEKKIDIEEKNIIIKIEKNEKNEIKNINNINENLIKYKSKLIYKGKEKLILQKMVIDELGITSFIKNDFNPDYEMYYNEKELVIIIECPEGVKLSAKRKRNKGGDYPFGIEIIGEKIEDKKIENVKYIKTKTSGKFYALIPFTDNEYALEKGTEEEPKNGWKKFIFPISKIEDD